METDNMSNVLIVIDMQNDFVTGSLGNKDAQMIVPNVKAKIKEYADRGDRIFYKRYPRGELSGYTRGKEAAGKALY